MTFQRSPLGVLPLIGLDRRIDVRVHEGHDAVAPMLLPLGHRKIHDVLSLEFCATYPAANRNSEKAQCLSRSPRRAALEPLEQRARAWLEDRHGPEVADDAADAKGKARSSPPRFWSSATKSCPAAPRTRISASSPISHRHRHRPEGSAGGSGRGAGDRRRAQRAARRATPTSSPPAASARPTTTSPPTPSPRRSACRSTITRTRSKFCASGLRRPAAS